MQGAVLTFYSFIGFEDILNVSEEVKNPSRNVPFGLIGAMILATVHLHGRRHHRRLRRAVAGAGEKRRRRSWRWPGVRRRGSSASSPSIGFITIFAIGNTALLNYLMGSRLLYGMSRQGLLPAVLAKIHPKRHSPHVAVAVLFGIVSLLILSGGVKQLAESTVLLLLSVFTVVNVSLVVLKRRPGEPRGGFEPPHDRARARRAGLRLAHRRPRAKSRITSADTAQRTAPLIAGAIILDQPRALHGAQAEDPGRRSQPPADGWESQPRPLALSG